jgi:hypothetical protein
VHCKKWEDVGEKGDWYADSIGLCTGKQHPMTWNHLKSSRLAGYSPSNPWQSISLERGWG